MEKARTAYFSEAVCQRKTVTVFGGDTEPELIFNFGEGLLEGYDIEGNRVLLNLSRLERFEIKLQITEGDEREHHTYYLLISDGKHCLVHRQNARQFDYPAGYVTDPQRIQTNLAEIARLAGAEVPADFHWKKPNAFSWPAPPKKPMPPIQNFKFAERLERTLEYCAAGIGFMGLFSLSSETLEVRLFGVGMLVTAAVIFFSRSRMSTQYRLDDAQRRIFLTRTRPWSETNEEIAGFDDIECCVEGGRHDRAEASSAIVWWTEYFIVLKTGQVIDLRQRFRKRPQGLLKGLGEVTGAKTVSVDQQAREAGRGYPVAESHDGELVISFQSR